MRTDDGTWAKVPQVTLGFWLIKILATTLGETGGDAVTMSIQASDPKRTLVQSKKRLCLD